MIDESAAPVAPDWVGVLILAVAPAALMPSVSDAAARAESTVLSDPVLGDMARVATTTTTPDPLAGEIDDIALTLHRELIGWALSPVRNPAPRVAFGVLVVHPDAVAAVRLVRRLAAASVMSEIPVVFRVGSLSGEGGTDPDADVAGQVARMILDAVDATAREIEQVNDFAIPVARLREPATHGAPAPQPPPVGTTPRQHGAVPAATVAQPAAHPAVRHEPDPSGSAVPGSQAVPSGQRAPSTPVAAPDKANPATRAGLPDEATTSAPDDALPGRAHEPDAADDEPAAYPQGASDDRPSARLGFRARLRSAVTRLVEHRAPDSTVDVIDELSRRNDPVTLLYLVVVSEPVPPPRRNRRRRAAMGMELVRAVSSDSDPWYVRAFTADQHLRPAAPLPQPDRLRERDIPARWGEYFDLFDCIGDITQAWARDLASFVRRGLTTEPHRVVVFLAGELPAGNEEAAQRFAELGAAADVVWVAFAPRAFETLNSVHLPGMQFFADHDDLVNEIVQILTNSKKSRR